MSSKVKLNKELVAKLNNYFGFYQSKQNLKGNKYLLQFGLLKRNKLKGKIIAQYENNNNKLVNTITNDKIVINYIFLDKGNKMVVATEDCVLVVFDVNTGEKLSTLQPEEPIEKYYVQAMVKLDEYTFFCTQHTVEGMTYTYELIENDLKKKHEFEVDKAVEKYVQIPKCVLNPKIFPNNDLYLICSFSGYIVIYDHTNGCRITKEYEDELMYHITTVYDAVIVGNSYITCGMDKHPLGCWDFTFDEKVMKLREDFVFDTKDIATDGVMSAVYLENNLFAVGGDNGNVTVFDSRRKEQVYQIKGDVKIVSLIYLEGLMSVVRENRTIDLIILDHDMKSHEKIKTKTIVGTHNDSNIDSISYYEGGKMACVNYVKKNVVDMINIY